MAKSGPERGGGGVLGRGKHRKKNKITLPICPSLPLCVLSGLQEVGKAQTALFLEQEKEKTKG